MGQRAPANDSNDTQRVLRVGREYIQKQAADIGKNQDLSRYIL